MKCFCELCRCHIRESTIFSDLSEEQLSTIKKIIRVIPVDKKGFIFHERDECKGLYVVKKGKVKLVRVSRSGKEQIINIVSPGGILGMEIFYNASGYSTTATAMEDTELCFISRECFEEILLSYPAIGRKMITALSRELEHAYEKIGSLGLMTARQKVADLICAIANDAGYGDEDGGARLRLPLSRLEIAEILGITQETSIRLLRDLKEDGLIDIKGKEIVIPSLARLKDVAEI